MSHLREPLPVKLVFSILYVRVEILQVVCQKIVEQFGEIDKKSAPHAFPYPAFYNQEMGDNISRQFIAMKKLVARGQLVTHKLYTNDLEHEISKVHGQSARLANIDPGHLAAEKFVLATGKNYTHRIYLDQGVFADLTLMFKDGQYRPLPWTYPDYGENPANSFLNALRSEYLTQVKG